LGAYFEDFEVWTSHFGWLYWTCVCERAVWGAGGVMMMVKIGGAGSGDGSVMVR
jgi:hypothetical protein